MIGLEGHRARGGLRASLYNAIGIEAVTQLINFMREFKKRYG
jgi:phosphoserine aminotransferase